MVKAVKKDETVEEIEENAELHAKEKELRRVLITAPNMQLVSFRIRGSTPLVLCKFSQKAKEKIREAQEQKDKKAGTKKVREPRDFEADYRGAMHVADEGWLGISSVAFRIAMVDACRLVNYKMTLAKMSVFVDGDGFDNTEATPLTKIIKGKPKMHMAHVRNESGVVDLRARPLWVPGWEADVRVRIDADQFTVKDVTNLLMRVGLQVGIGEGRPFSKNSCGQGWGLFDIVNV